MVLILCVAAWWVQRIPLDDKIYPETQGNTISIILLDGLSKKVFHKELAAGNLPNLKSLIDKSTYVENGISSFPTMTGYGYYPFITGIDGAESGIYGLRWFDRKRDVGNLRNYVGRTNLIMNDDTRKDIANIFEKAGDQYTASINTFMNRGVDDNIKTGWQLSTAKFYDQWLFDWLRAIPFWGEQVVFDYKEHETHVMNIAKAQLSKNPKVQWLTLPCLDALNHIEGTPKSYNHLLIHIDSLIGDFVKEINELGQEQTRALAIISDHGVQDVDKNLDLRKALDDIGLDMQRGKSIHIATDKLKEALSDFEDKDGYIVVNGNLSNYLYIKDPNKADPDSWRNKLRAPQLRQYNIDGRTVDLIEHISDQQGIDIVAAQVDDYKIVVQRGKQKAYIEHNAEGWKYDTTYGDPLQYTADSTASALLDNNFHSADEWLAHSLSTAYPDAVYRIGKLMLNEDVGEILVCSKAGYDLAADYELFVGNYKGGHGGLHEDLINVPYIFYNPAAPAQKVTAARSEEIGKWIMAHLGY